MRIKAFLIVRMQATAHPYAITQASKDLAEMLGLPKPETAGTRRVNKAFSDLVGLQLVSREMVPGRVPITTVLDPRGSGDSWSDKNLREGFITLPIDLWRRGWLIALSGRALALLIILRELTHGRKVSSGTWVDGIRKREYGLSDDTWTKATQELCEAGLLEVKVEVHSSRGEPRRRNLYRLHLERLGAFAPGEMILENN